MTRIRFVFVAFVVVFASPADAADPAAIVEEISSAGAGVRFLDYLEPGRVIDLGSTGTITIGYLASCLRETITGGLVTIGTDKSRLNGAAADLERVECDGGGLKLSSNQSGKSAVMVLRAPPRASTSPQPSVILYGASPVIKLPKGAARVMIERLDRDAEKIALGAENGFVDLAAKGKSLKPGGIYRAQSGDKSVVFRIDRRARSGAGPIIGRLVQL